MIESRFGTSPAPTACGCLSDKSVSRKAHIARTRKYGPGGEGREHLRIKEWLREHPELIGMNDIVRATAEHVFPSGDCADLLFKRGDGGYSVVEIETMAPLSGAYRIIKHRALLCAEQGLEIYQRQKNGTNLVDEGNISGTTTNILSITGISDSDAGSYSVIVSNSDGSVTSSNAVLMVDDFLFIASQPQSQCLV
jgi:hypothetical protein